jgi:hypothetical protein
MRMIAILALAAASAACGGEKKAAKAPAADAPTTAAASQPTVSGPASDDAEASADTAWIELMGEWAPEGACGDYMRMWIIEASAFHLYEMHCAVGSIALDGDGVRAVADCTVEGDDDGVDDVYTFERRKDATLTISQIANGAKTEGLVACSDDMIP